MAGNTKGQIRHGSAATTHAVRAAIQRSQASLAHLSKELGINPKTVAKWRKRATPRDGRACRGARGASIALACRAFGVSETCYRYGPKQRAENEEIADLLTGLTDARKTRGFGQCFLHLRNVKGHPWNHKRVYPLAVR
jgi:hypothetical protein